MKKILSISFIALLASLVLISCKKDDGNDAVSIEYSTLPQSAKSFISGNFSESDVSSVKQYPEVLLDGTKYILHTKTSYMMTFDTSGNWIVVGGAALPASMFTGSDALAEIKVYTDEEYKGDAPIAIQKKTNTEIQVDLKSGVQLTFDSTGNFLRKK